MLSEVGSKSLSHHYNFIDYRPTLFGSNCILLCFDIIIVSLNEQTNES